LVLAMTDMLLDLYRTSQSLDLNLVVAIYNKLELNRRKYPVDLCKVREYRLDYFLWNLYLASRGNCQSQSHFFLRDSNPTPTALLGQGRQIHSIQSSHWRYRR
jgi:hypothetical protein